MLLAHPEAETLGRFVEGTLDDPERAAIVDHLADCDDCRILVVDAAEFESQNTVETEKWGIARWLAISAAAMFVVTLGIFSRHEYREKAAGREIDIIDDATHFTTDYLDTGIRDGEWLLKRLGLGFASFDPLAKVEETYGKQESRPLEARLSGFPYVERHTMRGGNGEDVNVNTLILQGEAADVAELHGNSAEAFHARGIGRLLSGNVSESIDPLREAATREPRNVKYQSDLAAALIAAARGDHAKLESALAACDRALRIDPRSPDALFNRAKALQALDQPDEAVAAYDRYLAVDPSSPWAAEARRTRDLLRPLP